MKQRLGIILTLIPLLCWGQLPQTPIVAPYYQIESPDNIQIYTLGPAPERVLVFKRVKGQVKIHSVEVVSQTGRVQNLHRHEYRLENKALEINIPQDAKKIIIVSEGLNGRGLDLYRIEGKRNRKLSTKVVREETK